MSLKSTSSSRILQLESSLYPENPPKQNPPPLTLTPVEPLEDDGPGIKGFWLFKKNNQNRAGPKNVPSKRVGVGASSLERSWSEPNSPTELTYSGFTGRENSESKVNYISKAEKLLEESKVRFYGNMKPWEEFSERFKNLFSNGRPAGGKLVKPHTPVHGAQAIARSIVEDMQAALEAMDREMLVDDSSISTTNLRENVRPIRTLMPEPWFEPSTVNPVNFDKVKKPRSINPAGTWHGHSRSRNITIPKTITEFANPDSKNELVSKTDQGAIFSTAEVNTSGLAQDRDVEGKEGRPNQGERERDRGNGKAKEFGQETGSERTYRDRDGEASVFKELERGRKDGSRHHRNDIPLIEDALRPEPPRERQISDPAIYTRSPYKRLASPDSLSPAVYTLAEDVEVRDGSSSTKTPNGRNIARTPRAPTIVNYPDEDVAYGSFSPSLSRAGSSARTDPLIGGFVVSPLSPVAGVQGPNTPTNAGSTGHRRRRRSRSLNHEFNARSSKDRPRTRDKDRDCERERPRGKVWERDDRGRDRDRDREKEKGKERDRGRQRDKERDREKKVRDRDKDRERDRDKEQDRERGKDKEREREKDKDKYGGTRIKNPEGERDRERRGSGGRRHKDQNRGRDKLRDRDRGKEKERDRDNGLNDRGQKRDRERDRDRDRDRNHKDRNYDHNRAERERLTNPPSPALVLASAGFAPSDATTSVPGAYRDGPIPIGSAASSGTTPPLPPHSVPRAIYQLGVPMNGPLPPNPASDSRFMEILTSPVPAMHFNLPG